MRIRVIRASRSLAAIADAHSIQPRLDVAAFPDAVAGLLRLPLRSAVLSFGILRPVQRQPLFHQPVSEINSSDTARRYRPAISVQTDWIAAYWLLRDEGIQRVGRFGAAAIPLAVLASTKLIAFRRIDPPQPDPGAVNFEGISVDDAGLPNQIVSDGAIWR